jgi:type VI secretion system protein ImpF
MGNASQARALMRNGKEHFQVPLMFAFRDAFEQGDAKKRIEERVGGERVISGRGSLKRRGADETLLKRNLALDLLSLVNTIDLASAVDVSGLDYVGRSVLNFGLSDVSRLTSQEIGVEEIAVNLKVALLNHEPRLRSETLRVEKDVESDEIEQRIRFTVSAEMACKPLDVPMEFAAEVEVGSGKVRLTRLPVPL